MILDFLPVQNTNQIQKVVEVYISHKLLHQRTASNCGRNREVQLLHRFTSRRVASSSGSDYSYVNVQQSFGSHLFTQ